MQLEKCFLGEVFGFGYISDHAQAEGVDAPLVERIELGESIMIAGLSPHAGHRHPAKVAPTREVPGADPEQQAPMIRRRVTPEDQGDVR